jgi:predicted short-subunit dehydrogenase-like oxidoreductase (DUF2520 family)
MVSIVGPGRVGGSLASALASGGHKVRSFGREDDLAALEGSDVVIVAVPDAAVAEMVARCRDQVPDRTLIVHTCGLLGLEVFEGREMAGCVHPATPISTREEALDGVWFGVTATPAAKQRCEELVEAIGGRYAHIPSDQRVSYHAALVHASNHLVALAADAESLLADASPMLVPLLERTVSNISRLGVQEALTGPVSRGDAETVLEHLKALPTQIAASYRENARRTLELAVAAGRLDAEGAERVRKVLDA